MVFKEGHGPDFAKDTRFGEVRELLDGALDEHRDMLSPSRIEIVDKVRKMTRGETGF